MKVLAQAGAVNLRHSRAHKGALHARSSLVALVAVSRPGIPETARDPGTGVGPFVGPYQRYALALESQGSAAEKGPGPHHSSKP